MSWLINSSIGRKFIMSISGLFLILFLIFHMSMNMVLVFSPAAYDQVTHFLGANWYAIVGTTDMLCQTTKTHHGHQKTCMS